MECAAILAWWGEMCDKFLREMAVRLCQPPLTYT